jgi:hypothetical protein
MIYLFAIIPLLFALWLLKEKISSKNGLIILGTVTVVTILTIFIIDRIFWWNYVKDVEYLSSYVTHSKYIERWEEEVAVYKTDSEGNRKFSHYKGEWHDVQYIDITNCGQEIEISEKTYLARKFAWKNERFVELNRSDVYNGHDGDEYVTYHDGNIDHVVPIVCTNTYKNTVRKSGSVYKFANTNLKVYEYPVPSSPYAYHLNCPSILGMTDTPEMIYANSYLQKMNGLYGKMKQIKFWVCLFKDVSIDYGFAQEIKWEGGNKNEVVVCLGIDGKTNEIKWCYPFMWGNEELKQALKDSLMTQKILHMPTAAKTIANNSVRLFVRKQFADFDYLNVDHVSTSEIVTILIFIMIILIAEFIFISKLEV